MAVQASYQTTVNLGGASTAMVGEATTDAGDHKTYQITNAAKRALDPAVAVAVKVNGGGAEAANSYNVDYANGKVTFGVAKLITDVVTIDASYRPLLPVGQARGVAVDAGYGTADSAVFGDTGPRKTPLRSECTLKLDHLHLFDEDFDGGAGTQSLNSMASGSDPVFIEAKLGGAGGQVVRGWFDLRKGNQAASLTDVVSGSVDAEGVVRTCLGRPADAPAGLDQALYSFT